MLSRLTDQGEAIKVLYDLLQQEVNFRKELATVETHFQNLAISNADKHTQRLCSIEKKPEAERYKPFSTLNNVKEVKKGSKIFNIMEDCKENIKPTQLIPLQESLNIQKEQEDRVRVKVFL